MSRSRYWKLTADEVESFTYNEEKLRGIQAKMLKSSTKSISFSHVLNKVCEEGLKKFKP